MRQGAMDSDKSRERVLVSILDRCLLDVLFSSCDVMKSCDDDNDDEDGEKIDLVEDESLLQVSGQPLCETVKGEGEMTKDDVRSQQQEVATTR